MNIQRISTNKERTCSAVRISKRKEQLIHRTEITNDQCRYKIYSTSLTMKERQSKMSCHYIPIRIATIQNSAIPNAGEYVEKVHFSYWWQCQMVVHSRTLFDSVFRAKRILEFLLWRSG